MEMEIEEGGRRRSLPDRGGNRMAIKPRKISEEHIFAVPTFPNLPRYPLCNRVDLESVL